MREQHCPFDRPAKQRVKRTVHRTDHPRRSTSPGIGRINVATPAVGAGAATARFRCAHRRRQIEGAAGHRRRTCSPPRATTTEWVATHSHNAGVPGRPVGILTGEPPERQPAAPRTAGWCSQRRSGPALRSAAETGGRRPGLRPAAGDDPGTGAAAAPGAPLTFASSGWRSTRIGSTRRRRRRAAPSSSSSAASNSPGCTRCWCGPSTSCANTRGRRGSVWRQMQQAASRRADSSSTAPATSSAGAAAGCCWMPTGR